MKNTKTVAVIGAGISGIASAAYAAQQGFKVHVFEKNESIGGRARQFSTPNGYLFDMGPSWYWMPDIIEKFFNDFGAKASDFYSLVSLDPQFDMVFDDGAVSVPQNYDELKQMFEDLEPGAAEKLDDFMVKARYKYEVGMNKFVQKPGKSITEFLSFDVIKSVFGLDLLQNFKSYVAKYFSHPKIKALMEFPVIFLGAMPKDIPALYSLMNYGGYKLGTFYPMGGFIKVVEAMAKVAIQQGVEFHFNCEVQKMEVQKDRVEALMINDKYFEVDAIISSADYHFTETQLLEKKYRNYSDDYWESRVMAPSCLIYYLGFKKKLNHLGHHTLFFENDLEQHCKEIYENPQWPSKPLFYACCPSKTDLDVAPKGQDNVFLLLPLAPGLEDSEDRREIYFQQMIERLEKYCGEQNLLNYIDFKRSYCVNDFVKDYNAYKGNAYGLANTLKQTAIGKPSIRNKKVKNLIYTGQLTVPGPGVPPAIISGKIAAAELIAL